VRENGTSSWRPTQLLKRGHALGAEDGMKFIRSVLGGKVADFPIDVDLAAIPETLVPWLSRVDSCRWLSVVLNPPPSGKGICTRSRLDVELSSSSKCLSSAQLSDCCSCSDELPTYAAGCHETETLHSKISLLQG